ncbi:MAG: TetR/AcrR family transcriptional regulator C-terminal domain-containing protein, partial [Acidimicrobiia bacterium]
VVGRLRRAGLSDEDAHHAWQMLASHTMGYAFQSANKPGFGQTEMTNLHVSLDQIGDDYPNVAAIGPQLANCQWDREYMFGLEIIIDGLQARLN